MGVHDLSDPRISLDLSSPLWALKKEQASEAFGLDVVSPNRFKPDPWRRPVGVSIPVEDRPLTSVIPMGLRASIPIRTSAMHRLDKDSDRVLTWVVVDDGTYDSTTGEVDLSVTLSTPLTDYVRRSNDVLLIHSPSSMKGVYPVRTRVDDDKITIDKGLFPIEDPPSPPEVSSMACALVQGEQLLSDRLTDPDTSLVETWVVKSKELYDLQGPWSSDCEGFPLQVNSDLRASPSSTDVVKKVDSYAQERDALVCSSSLRLSQGGAADNLGEDKVSIVCSSVVNRRGFVVTNGRKFWLQQDGTYTLLLDLGSDDFLGTVWKGAQIATNRLMLVTPRFVPRILHLDRKGLLPLSDTGEEILAGCVPPRKPLGIEVFEEAQDRYDNPSWLGDVVTTGVEGDLTLGTELRVLVRGVNLEDNLSSEFVAVLVAEDRDFPTTVKSAGTRRGLKFVVESLADALVLFTSVHQDSILEGWPPIFHSRLTHIEVWRTQVAQASAFYLESRIEMADLERGEVVSAQNDLVDRAWLDRSNNAVSGLERGHPVRLADEDILQLPIATQTILSGGRLPPVCRDVVSLLGVTFCFGRAASDRVDPVLYAKNFFGNKGVYSSGGAFQGTIIAATNYFTNYVLQEGDQLVVTDPGSEPNNGVGIPRGVYDITAKPTLNSLTIDADLVPAGDAPERVNFYIRRPFTIEWTHIESDEDVWYSRTDQFEPESFLPRILRLSEIGDTFRRVVPVGKYLAVIMEQGVHLIFMDGITPVVDTIAVRGAGTSWPDSVLVFENIVYWASSQGIRKMTVSNQPDELGHRARLSLEGQAEYLDFFREAELNGDTIDAGLDTKNGTMRFRRRSPDAVTAGSLSGFLNSVERNAESSEDTVLDL